MGTALLVSDNALFIRRAVTLLEGMLPLDLSISLNSSDIFEAYLRHHPTLIILDNFIVTPIPSILRHFATYRWDCSFLVLGKPSDGFALPKVLYADMESTSLCHALTRWEETRAPLPEAYSAALASAALQESHPLQPDVYYLMLSIRVDAAEETIGSGTLQCLEQRLATIGDTEVCSALQNDLLILMKKSAMHAQGAFRQVHSIVCQTIEQGYASIYCEDLRLSELDHVLAGFMEATPLSCFFVSKCVDFRKLPTLRHEISAAEVFALFEKLLSALFSASIETVQDILHQWYLSRLKSSLALAGMQMSEDWLGFFSRTILAPFLETPLPAVPNGSIESRYGVVSEHWKQVFQSYRGAPFLPVVQSSIALLIKRYSDDGMSLEQVARELGFSKAYVSRIFREQTGITLVDFLQQLRVECARGLLRTTTDSIRAVAEAVGYMDAQYFSRLFHRHVGVYPTEYRTLCRKGDTNASAYPQ